MLFYKYEITRFRKIGINIPQIIQVNFSHLRASAIVYLPEFYPQPSQQSINIHATI